MMQTQTRARPRERRTRPRRPNVITKASVRDLLARTAVALSPAQIAGALMTTKAVEPRHVCRAGRCCDALLRQGAVPEELIARSA